MTRKYPTNLLQIVFQFMIMSKVILKSIIGPDDTTWSSQPIATSVLSTLSDIRAGWNCAIFSPLSQFSGVSVEWRAKNKQGKKSLRDTAVVWKICGLLIVCEDLYARACVQLCFWCHLGGTHPCKGATPIVEWSRVFCSYCCCFSLLS